jgi:DNA-binding HxlR family transcriptional regulator
VARLRRYQQFCSIAAALNAVGDRWALLIVRELLLGPQRFTDLEQGVGGIGTDILTARLRALEASGVVQRSGEGPRQRYELTANGQALRPVLIELARWGADRRALPANPKDIPIRRALTSLVLDPPPLPPTIAGAFEIRAEHEIALVTVDAGKLTLAPTANGGADDPAVTTIELTHAGILALLDGARPKAVRASGDLVIAGQVRAATALLDALASAVGPRP